jgi:Tfp pilus assembly protein PilO
MALPTPTNISQEQFHRYYQKLQPMMKKPKMRASTTAVFSFLAISLFAWYAIRPTAQTIIHLRREIADKTVLNEQMENKITALIEAQATFQEIEDRLPVIRQALPNNPDAIILARQLSNLAAYSGASISAIQIPSLPVLGREATPGAKLAQTKPLEDFPVSMVLTGQYASLKTFMDGLLKMRRIASVDTISLKLGLSKLVLVDQLQLSLKLTSYYSTE